VYSNQQIMEMREKQSVLDDIPYFIEWGQHGWTKLFTDALNNEIGTDLAGKRVLEIGSRFARISSLFALLGAEVWACDTGLGYREKAAEELKKWKLENRVHLLYGRKADMAEVADGSMDLAFTKSVLVLIKDLPGMLQLISSKLKPGGKVVFMENAYGNGLYNSLRAFKHRKIQGFKRTRYFTQKEIDLIGSIFPAVKVRRSWFPPVYLFVGSKPFPSGI